MGRKQHLGLIPSRRQQAGLAMLGVVTLVAMFALAKVYVDATWEPPEERALEVVRAAGIDISATSQGPVQSGDISVAGHRIFTTSDGRTGHVIRTNGYLEGSGAAFYAAAYVPGKASDNYMVWSSRGDRRTVVVLVGRTNWTTAQRDALDGWITHFK